MSTMSRPLILVTNDDGITAPGIKALIEVASEFGDLIVVAPDSAQSGMGHAVTLNNPIRLHQVDLFGDIPAYECTGTPVDCVKLAKNILLKDRKADLCVSGINHGSNASINIIYSGTMSAAMEASLENIPSIGFSLLDYSHQANFEPGKPFIRQLIAYVLANGMEHGTLWNVNIPKLPEGQIKGIKMCRQADASWEEEFVEAFDPRGQRYYWMTGNFVNKDKGEDTDISALTQGYVSVVPSMHDLTNYTALHKLQSADALHKLNGHVTKTP
jgi:5'-nucleotidase